MGAERAEEGGDGQVQCSLRGGGGVGVPHRLLAAELVARERNDGELLRAVLGLGSGGESDHARRACRFEKKEK